MKVQLTKSQVEKIISCCEFTQKELALDGAGSDYTGISRIVDKLQGELGKES